MGNNSFNNYKFIDYSILGLVLITASYVYVGFFYVDPYSLARFGNKFLAIVWGARLLFPILILLSIYLYHSIKIQRLSKTDLTLMLASVLFSFLIMYPFGEYIYKRFGGIHEKLNDFHPYLQLKPKELNEESLKPGSNLKIFCIGGSTTEFTPGDKAGWPQRVQSILEREERYTGVNVLNLGRQWYTSLHTLINYQANLRQHRPDVIIVMHAINDLLHNADESYFSHGSFREDYGHFYGPLNRLISTDNYITQSLGKLRFWYHRPRKEIITDEFPGLVSFRRYLHTLIDIAMADGTDVVLMTQPYLIKKELSSKEKTRLKMLNVETCGPTTKWSHLTALHGMQKYNQATIDIANERGVHLIDLEKAIPKTLEYFYDEVHYTKKAFDAVAKFIATEIIKNNLVSVE